MRDSAQPDMRNNKHPLPGMTGLVAKRCRGWWSCSKPLIVFLIWLLVTEGRGGLAAETIRLPVTRDLWVSNVGDERDGNNGQAPAIKLKSIQEMTLVDFDPAPLKGRTIRSATLHLKVRGNEIIHRMTASTVAAEWIEGTSYGYRKENGASTFRRRKHPDQLWAGTGSDLTSVVLGNGGSMWRMADAFLPDSAGWQTVAIDPLILSAQVAGLSDGLLLFDDTGSEWTRNGETFTYRLFPNRFFFSRDSNASSAPYFTVEVGDVDSSPPEPVGQITIATEELPGGEALVRWNTPADQGPAGTIGFVVSIDERPVPRWMIPAAGPALEPVEMHVRQFKLLPGTTHRLSIQAVDAAGNVSSATTAALTVSHFVPRTLVATPTDVLTMKDSRTVRKLGNCEIQILDLLDKVHPVSGVMTPPQPASYPTSNHLWNSDAGEIRLQAAGGEIVGFQVLLKGATSRAVIPEVSGFETTGGKIRSNLSRLRCVKTDAGPMPDIAVPIGTGLRIPSVEDNISGQTSGSLLVELIVPKNAVPGMHSGSLILKDGSSVSVLKITLQVHRFLLPDELTFLAEMNCYDVPGGAKNPELERSYYRLAHWHRTTLNRVPYFQNGKLADGCGPEWNGQQLDWTAWDERFQPLLNGVAFADLPRSKVPLECFYLPLHENWPMAMDGNYNGDYWADRAFTRRYQQTFAEVSRQFAQHLQERQWNRTLFLGYLNNKVDFKRNGWSRASSPWLLDEPANWQDYQALKFFGELFHEGAQRGLPANDSSSARVLFRADISRPEWQREALDEVLDYNVVSSGAFRRYRSLVIERQRRQGQFAVVYGTTNHPVRSNIQPAAWCWDVWLAGGDGVLPWQTIGTGRSWQSGEDTCLFYPGNPAGQLEPVPSVRLKSYLRGQQDAEYLLLLSTALNLSREQTAAYLRETMREMGISLEGEVRATGFAGGEDAGTVDFGNLKAGDLWRLRTRIASVIQRELKNARTALPLEDGTTLKAIVRRPIPQRDINRSRESRMAKGLQPPFAPRWKTP